MKNLFNNLKNKVMKTKAEAIAVADGIAMGILAPQVSAAMEGMDKMKPLIEEILKYIPIIGVPIVVVGAFKLVMAFRNDQGDAVPGAAKDIAIGIILCLFGGIGGSVLNSL